MAKFLIIRFSSIGDIIQCMNVVNGIKNHFPDAEIHWIARKDMGSFLNMDKRIDRVWGFDKKTGLKGLLRVAKELKAEKFDYIYDAHSNIRSNILKAVLLPPFYSLFPRGPHYTLRGKERWKRFLLFKLGMGYHEFRIGLFRLVLPRRIQRTLCPHLYPEDHYPSSLGQLGNETLASQPLAASYPTYAGIPIYHSRRTDRHIL